MLVYVMVVVEKGIGLGLSRRDATRSVTRIRTDSHVVVVIRSWSGLCQALLLDFDCVLAY